jgi:hypothetical protein
MQHTKFFSFVALLLLTLGTSLSLVAQDVKFRANLDASPMDAAHYPRRAAFKNYLEADDPDRTQFIKVLYCRPMKKDREIFGGLVPYGQDWRLGANEATEVTFFTPVEIGGTYVPSGSYTMFAQPYPSHWIIKLSTERFIAGAENRDITQDFVAVSVPTQQTAEVRESFTIGFQKVDEGQVNMVFAWDQTRVELPINLNATALAGDDASPMDLVQYPANSRIRNYVEAEEFEASAPQIRLVYSRPQMKGRKIFGEMLAYGDMWRLGANETTTVTFFQDVEIGGKKLRAGTYGLFAKVNNGSWDFIVHNNVQSWGTPNHDESDNVVTVTAKTEATPETLEALSATFVEKGDNMVELVFGWENTMARLPIKVMK